MLHVGTVTKPNAVQFVQSNPSVRTYLYKSPVSLLSTTLKNNSWQFQNNPPVFSSAAAQCGAGVKCVTDCKMLSSLVKDHQARQTVRKEQQEIKRKEALTAANNLTTALVDHLNVGVAQVGPN